MRGYKCAVVAGLLGFGAGMLTTFMAVSPSQEKIEASLKALGPELKVESVYQSPIDGLSQVELNDGEIVYVDSSTNYVIHGVMLKIAGDQVYNLTSKTKSEMARQALKKIPAEDMVVFPATNKKGAITVFTDPDCPYCQELHKLVPELNEQGIEVRYLAFPRMGVDSPIQKKMSSAWCSEDRAKAIEKLFNQEELEEVSCADPVIKQFALGNKLGVRGTPSIFLETGELIPGLMPVEQIVEAVTRNTL